MRYQISFVDHGGRVFSNTDLDANDDDEVIARSRRILMTGIGAFFQIYKRGRLIYTQPLSVQGAAMDSGIPGGGVAGQAMYWGKVLH